MSKPTGRRRINGEGTIYEDRDRGGYIGLLFVDGKRRKVRARTRVDVLTRFDALKRAADAGIVVDGNTTVGEILDRWRDRVLPGMDLAPSTRARYDWALTLLHCQLGKTRLRGLDVNVIERALDRIATGEHGRGAVLSRSSVAKVRGVLVTVLDFAERRRMISGNPARLSVVSPTAAAPQGRRALEADEAAALWNALEGERLGPLYRLMLLTGLRPGEGLGVCWDAVDLDAGTLTVRRAVRLERGAARLVDELKTTASYRTIALPAPAVDVLRAQRRIVAEMKLAARTWVTADPGLVFPSVTGGPWNPANARVELARICTDNDLPVIRPNELRHSCASVLSAKGVALEQIADLLGHTSTRMLDMTYRHRPRRAVDAAVEVMGAMFGGAERT